MTAALIFWRQLVRHSFKLATSSTAAKLPLKKFHRLLDLAFWAGGASKISKAAKVLSLTNTRSSPHITL
jgi:hypothetical protein